jgi:DNA-binding MarR family transcriptional regulator
MGAAATIFSMVTERSRGATSTKRAQRNGNESRQTRREDIGAVLRALSGLVRALHASHRSAEQRWNVSAAQLLVLDKLADAPAHSVNDLAERTLTHQSTVSVVVKRLVRRGLVRRQRSLADGRRTELALTTAGRSLRDRATTQTTVSIVDALGTLPRPRLRNMRACLDTLIALLDPRGDGTSLTSSNGEARPASRTNGGGPKARSARGALTTAKI